jgi:hypothetical protein
VIVVTIVISISAPRNNTLIDLVWPLKRRVHITMKQFRHFRMLCCIIPTVTYHHRCRCRRFFACCCCCWCCMSLLLLFNAVTIITLVQELTLTAHQWVFLFIVYTAYRYSLDLFGRTGLDVIFDVIIIIN